jgi:hypothetical protein
MLPGGESKAQLKNFKRAQEGQEAQDEDAAVQSGLELAA